MDFDEQVVLKQLLWKPFSDARIEMLSLVANDLEVAVALFRVATTFDQLDVLFCQDFGKIWIYQSLVQVKDNSLCL